MKLGVLTVPLQGLPAEEAFAYLHSLGVQAVELGTGGYTNHNHLNPDVYLKDDAKIEEFKALLKKYELEISVLSCHGNPVHPDKATAEAFHNVFVDTCKLAQKLGVDTVVTFSGCPGDCPELGDLRVAERIRRDFGVAMERGADPVLEESGGNRQILRCEEDRV